MTSRDPGQEFDPKHRIIGAVVVVALAVILIPMILTDRATTESRAIAPEEPRADEIKVAITPVTPPAEEREQAPAPRIAAAAPPPAPAAKPEPKPTAPATAKAPAPAEARPSSGWVVQVGTFSNIANATRLKDKLRAQGQPVLAENIRLNGKKAVRLRVGPYRDRATADKTLALIQKHVGVKGVVLAYP